MKSVWLDFMPQRILILHEDVTISRLLGHALSNHGYRTTIGQQVDERTYVSGYDLVLIDMNLFPSYKKLLNKMHASFDPSRILQVENYDSFSSLPKHEIDPSVSRVKMPIDLDVLIQFVNEMIEFNRKPSPQIQVSTRMRAFRIKEIEIYPDHYEIKKKTQTIFLKQVELYIFLLLLEYMDECVMMYDLRKVLADHTQREQTIQRYISDLRKKMSVFEGDLEIKTVKNKGYRLVLH